MSSDSPDISLITETTAGGAFMERCLKLAELGAGYTAPNPLVGAVLVHENRIIGEGYHQLYGGPHAEVNCIGSVKEDDRPLIPFSTLYVSLEPCVHHGKTPPCTELILREKIQRVVVGCRDPFSEVDGKGIEKLLADGVTVDYPVLNVLCKQMNRLIITFQQ
jgi:diaminohydroxyphosphoribosylaminopyrimidine deaminase / 5-amino-6-(5-phosphoribosylamino)uracil reductase